MLPPPIRRELRILRTIISRCDGVPGAPLWEPGRPRPRLGVEQALTGLLSLESRLHEAAMRELRLLSLYLAYISVPLVAAAVTFVIVGSPEGAVGPAALWLAVALWSLSGRALDTVLWPAYWLGETPFAMKGTSRLQQHRAILLELFDLWAAVPDGSLPSLRQLTGEAGARRVLLVVDTAWSFKSRRGTDARAVEPARRADSAPG